MMYPGPSGSRGFTPNSIEQGNNTYNTYDGVGGGGRGGGGGGGGGLDFLRVERRRRGHQRQVS